MNRADPTGMFQTRNPMLPPPNAEQVQQFRVAAGVVVDFIPVVGDAKGVAEFINEPTILSGAAAAVGLVPFVGDIGKAALKNSDVVIRGGLSTADSFANGSGVVRELDGTLSGVSVNSAPGATAAELGSTVRNKRMGTSTVGDIRAAGGTITRAPTPENPTHCIMCGLTPAQAEELFNPPILNPNPKP